jgi:hypothetical protein
LLCFLARSPDRFYTRTAACEKKPFSSAKSPFGTRFDRTHSPARQFIRNIVITGLIYPPPAREHGSSSTCCQASNA